MKSQPLWQISVATSPEAEEAVSELLQAVFGDPASTYTKVATGTSTVAIYRAGPTAASFTQRRALVAGLERIRAVGLRIWPGKISVRRLPPEDWAESWKRHFQPLEVGPALLIKPSWSRRRPRAGQAVVVLDPGLSFGTGQHPTTRFCLQHLAARRTPARRQSFLDLGSGSGILAIAAARLGYAPVLALDFDREAVRVARANARQNGVVANLRIVLRDVAQLPSQSDTRYDVVCANLTSTVLVAERDRLVSRVARNGALVLAGVLKREFAEVRRAYESAGLRLVASQSAQEWRSGAFTFAGSDVAPRTTPGKPRIS